MPNDNARRNGRTEPVKDVIDENLRLVYQEIVREGTPERFRELLMQLQAARGGKSE